MAIPLRKEPESLTPWGSERCCFCRNTTPYWYAKKDVAVCKTCAKTHTIEEVPSKEEWWKSEVRRQGGT
jgi:predicted amidophosphoribosyltransferase